ncbi:hypothetical protein FD41_GL002524 [Lentilactobacillus farraginis DSM 18382 = JCM 14108]|uniref:Uncharacterized protein n=1 Tax=Lentilactobacillus farraginis DSM 18382 = JCM 14108 TaxID=1423743 RepID=A0A0R1VUY0_9LACO|nr:hypothetical protein FD41_GL002524 [Lentilactobacillus farraginis DSM 18382 = JCM 14108]
MFVIGQKVRKLASVLGTLSKNFLGLGVDECGVIRYIYLCCFSELPSFDFQQFS